jgi:hypothetical protein
MMASSVDELKVSQMKMLICLVGNVGIGYFRKTSVHVVHFHPISIWVLFPFMLSSSFSPRFFSKINMMLRNMWMAYGENAILISVIIKCKLNAPYVARS